MSTILGSKGWRSYSTVILDGNLPGTLFDLQETTAMVREKTSHLKGLKIAVMGCIVNGPGEMADADYCYVGTGINKVSLYKGHDLVKRNIDSKNSIDELIKLIKKNNDWINP